MPNPTHFPEALLFDLDGTLAKTDDDLHAAMNHVLNLYDCAPVDTKKITHMIGGGARMILARGFAENNHKISETALDEATAKFVTYYEQHIDDKTVLYPYIIDCLSWARESNIKLAVVTNKRESLAAKLLFRLNIHHFFPVLIGRDTCAKAKPHALPLEEACRRLGVAIDKSVMIGDSETDTAAARAANMKCICVTFGFRRVNLDELGADVLIDSFAHLEDALTNLT